jgi:hypothetical protein
MDTVTLPFFYLTDRAVYLDAVCCGELVTSRPFIHYSGKAHYCTVHLFRTPNLLLSLLTSDVDTVSQR